MIYELYRITDELCQIDFDTVHRWLAESYWSPGITKEKVEQAAKHSAVVIGAYDSSGKQVGYCRAVSDRTRFAWVADVYVDSAHRGHGLGKEIVSFLLTHPDLKDVGNWLLGTKDAHGVYEKLGFAPPLLPERLMQRVI
jgi:GNAT superfamily N-acetyltransferase